MPHAVVVPALGESITEGILVRWLVTDGATVNEDTPLYELETEKITTEVPAGANGTVRFSAKEGQTLPIGATVAMIEPTTVTDAANRPSAKPPASSGPGPTPATAPPAPNTPSAPVAGTTVSSAPRPATLSPAVAKLVADNDLDPSRITGTGKDGMITKGDVLAHLQRTGRLGTPASGAGPSARPLQAGVGGITAGPARPATPTTSSPPAASPGPAGKPPAAPAAPPAPAPAPIQASVKRTRMSPLRQRIAQRLIAAQNTAAILTTFNEIDMSACMGMRKRYKEEFEKAHGTGLGFMSFFTAAAVSALKRYPLINSQIEGTDIVSFEHINMGIAVGTEKGLVVPVLRNADQLDFAGIERGIRTFATKARDSKLTIEDMQGGTFTITNGGVYGSLMSTPILNPPQSGILGMHGIKDRPIAVGGEVVIRPMMYVALSYDHRIVDGSDAVGFLVRIKDLIEAPERLLLGL